MTQYDPSIIQRYADRNYARTTSAIVISVAIGLIIGFVVGPFITNALPATWAEKIPDWVWPTVFSVIGILQGLERGSTYKLQAQTALCQLQIEQHTRLLAEATTADASTRSGA